MINQSLPITGWVTNLNTWSHLNVSLGNSKKRQLSFNTLGTSWITLFIYLFFNNSRIIRMGERIWSFKPLAFASVRAKISLNFSVRTYFFYFIYSFFKNITHQIIYFILNFIKILVFLDFFKIISLFSHTRITIYFLHSFLRFVKKEKTTKYKMNGINVNLYSYFN